MAETQWMRHGVDTDIGTGSAKAGRVAVGPSCVSSAERGLVIGLRANAAAAGLAVGVDAEVELGGDTDCDGVAVGRWAHAEGGVAIGQSANATDGVAIGKSAFTNNNDWPYGGVALGRSAYATDLGVALGDSASATAGTAVGRSAFSTGEHSTATGRSSYAESDGTAHGASSYGGNGGTALGYGAGADNGAVALGTQAWADGDYVTAGPARLQLGVTGSTRETGLVLTDSDGVLWYVRVTTAGALYITHPGEG